MSGDKKLNDDSEISSIDEINKKLTENSNKSDNMDEMMFLKNENSDLTNKWQRALADYQNLERQTKVEISQRVSSKTNGLLLSFINIYEDFVRAEDSLSKDKINTDGIQAVIKNMENLLSENNIKPIDAIGEIFDPQIHEAVSMVEDNTLDEGTITREISKGYLSGKAILKPSKVIVSKK